MPIAEGKRAWELVEILDYAMEHHGIRVKDIPDISKVLEMDARKLYSLTNLSMGLLEFNKEKGVYTPTEKAGRITRGFYKATGDLVEILDYAIEHDGIRVKDIPDISKVLEMDARKLYSLTNFSWEMGLLEFNKEGEIYTFTKKAERFLKGYYRTTGELETKPAREIEAKPLTR